MTESWRTTFRNGFAPQLSRPALEALRLALASDSVALVQGACTIPPSLPCVSDWPVEAACAIARMCSECDQRLGEPAGCRWFLHWFDEAPRQEMRRELLAEVQLALAGRGPVEAVA